MSDLLHSKNVSVSIACHPDEVYNYVVNPANFPEWVTSFCQSVSNSGDGWILETTEGQMRLRFVDRNPYGILDHYVRVSSGKEFLNPLRVIPNGTGSELIFTVFQPLDMSDEQFAKDLGSVEQDLITLKRVLER